MPIDYSFRHCDAAIAFRLIDAAEVSSPPPFADFFAMIIDFRLRHYAEASPTFRRHELISFDTPPSADAATLSPALSPPDAFRRLAISDFATLIGAIRCFSSPYAFCRYAR
jgi:hypothetical protein